MRVWLTVLVLVFAPTLVRAQAEPSLEVTQDAEGWRFEVVNPGDQPLRLMTGPPRLSRALVRVDVRQPDGGWTAAHALTDFDLSLDQGRMVVPARGRVRLQPRLMFPVAELLGSPGHYRVVVFPHTPTGRVNLAQELDVSGWSTSLRDQAEDLRSRSLAAGCRVLPRRIDRALARRLEPRAMTALYESSADLARRASWAPVLFRRGSFVAPVEQTLARGAWGEAWPLIDRVSWSRRHLHRRLRRAAASRIARRMRSAATIDVATVHALERLWDGWNAIVFDAIAARIEAGPERGPAAVALVELLVFGSVSSEQEGQRATLLAAIDARCVDARGELGRACERARSRLAPRGCVVPSFRRGVAVSPVSAVRPATRGARSRPRRSAPCTALTREWEALEERGPAPETR